MSVKLFNVYKCFLQNITWKPRPFEWVKITLMFLFRPIKTFDFAFVLLVLVLNIFSVSANLTATVAVNQTIIASDDCTKTVVDHVDEAKEKTPDLVAKDEMSFVGPINMRSSTKSVKLSDIITKTPDARYTQKEVLDFLARGKFLERAILASKATDIPVSVLLAQTVLESDLGKSQLTQKTGNLGNVKCRCNRNPTLRKQHQQSNDSGDIVCVRGYDKIEKSNDWYEVIPSGWEDWNRRIEILSRYTVVANSRGKGYGWNEWTRVLHKSPYATDQNYGRKLGSIIRAYNLNGLDDVLDYRITSNTGKYTFWNPDQFR